MPGLDDQDPVRANDPDALVEDGLDQPRVAVHAAGQLHRLLARRHRLEVAKTAFGLGHDLLRDDQDVAVAQFRVLCDKPAEVVARLDLGQALDRDDLERFHTASIAARSSGSSRSRASARDR